MAQSLKERIQAGLVTRLETIKAANGYDTDVLKVFADEIPMGLRLDEFELPAIFVISGVDEAEMKHQCRHGHWNMELQLWHNEVSDAIMQRFVRDVYKAVFAGNATATTNAAFRTIDPALYDITPGQIRPDLNMIEANRCYWITLVLHYNSKLYDL